jgi:hypothetical protein
VGGERGRVVVMSLRIVLGSTLLVGLTWFVLWVVLHV